jgi:hypothetical protein
MKNHEPSQDERRTDHIETGFREKKTYRKPAFRHERIFEMRALLCGKVGGEGSSCSHNNKYS